MKRLLAISLLSLVMGCGGNLTYVTNDTLNKFSPGDRVKVVGEKETYYICSVKSVDGRWLYNVSNGLFRIEVRERELTMVDEFNPGTQHLQFNLVEPAVKVDESTKADKET